MTNDLSLWRKFLEVILHPERHRKEYKRLIKFAMVGASGAVEDFTLLNVGLTVFGLPLLVANVISVSAAIVNNFTWNRLWTFPESKTRRKRVQLLQFATVNGTGLVLNTSIVLLIDYFLNPIIGDPWSPNIAKACAIGIVLFWNFGMNRIWTYRGL